MSARAPFGFLGWMALAGALLLLMALSSSHLRRWPVSKALIYLGIGVGLSPLGLGWLRLDVTRTPQLIERVTEGAVIVSLFVGGLKLRLPLRAKAWRAAYRLAGPVMLLSVGGVAIVAHAVLGLPGPAALLLGAILAPTDPVLASAVTVNDARDADRVRYALSGEAGLNDGMAFPLVLLSLGWLEHGSVGGWTTSWLLERVLWAVPAGLLSGYALGRSVGRLVMWLRTLEPDSNAPNDLLVLALICLTYVGAEALHAFGFLAVFAAGLGLRHAEVRVVENNPHPRLAQRREGGSDTDPHPPAEHLVEANVEAPELKVPAISAGVLLAETLSFGQTLERLVEFLLVLFAGVALVEHWDPRAAVIAAALLVVVRPLAVQLCLLGTPTRVPQRWLIGWFGIRGIGSLYYLAYAQAHGLSGSAADTVAGLVVPVVALSIIAHGISVSPLLGLYEAALERRAATREARGRVG